MMSFIAQSFVAQRRFAVLSRRYSRQLVGVTTSQHSRTKRLVPLTAAAATTLAVAAGACDIFYGKPPVEMELKAVGGGDDNNELTTLLNWSGTHAVVVQSKYFWEPESVEEVEQIVKECNRKKRQARPLGSSLSPNGIAFEENGMISMVNLDQVINVDSDNMTVTVQAGARVSQVVDALRPYNLTLPNLASIAEQQIGGFVQVGAHGTGARIAPVDHYVTSLKIVTPGRGTLELSEKDGDLFHLAKVGLGCLGVVVEVTMQCVPAHNLVEHTFVLTRQEAIDRRDELLQKHKHMRYMWIPFQDCVVCVTNDPECDTGKLSKYDAKSDDARLKPFRTLLMDLTKDYPEPYTIKSMQGMGFGELRDAALAVAPLDVDHVKRCNKAEAEFWRLSEGYQVKPSDQLLQFDCGGQQWVLELCFETGKLDNNNGNDMKLTTDLLADIERNHIPAHSPIEQRWSASSSSYMSPAHGESDKLHSWVGIINYLPSDDDGQRRAIADLFRREYCELFLSLGSRIDAVSHWAKLERPTSMWKLVDLQLHYQNRFPLKEFNATRRSLDPNNIMSNNLLNLVLGVPNKEG